MVRHAIFLASLLCVANATATAQPGLGGSGPPPTDAAYATSLADRPLTLPSGLVEGTATMSTHTLTGYDGGLSRNDLFDWLYSDVVVRFGGGSVEGFVDANLLLSAPEAGYGYDTLTRIGAGLRIPVQTNRALMFRVASSNPTGDSNWIQTEAAYQVRRKTAANVAIFGSAGVSATKVYGEFVGDSGSLAASANAHVGGIVQVNQSMAAEFDIGSRVPIADDYDGYDRPAETDVGGRLVYVTPKLDAFVGMRFTSAGEIGRRTLFVGIAGRAP